MIKGARLPPCPCHFPWVLWQVLWQFVPIFYFLVIADLRQEVLHTSKVNRYQNIFIVLNLFSLLEELLILLRTWAKRRAKGDISWGDISRRWLCLRLELCSEILPKTCSYQSREILILTKGAGSFHIQRKTMKDLWALAFLGVREQPNLAQNLFTHSQW